MSYKTLSLQIERLQKEDTLQSLPGETVHQELQDENRNI